MKIFQILIYQYKKIILFISVMSKQYYMLLFLEILYHGIIINILEVLLVFQL